MSEKKEIFEQFRAAQSQFKAVLKDAVNPFYKSKYASLSSVLEAVLEPLNKNGLSLSQSVEDDKMITIIRNNGGEEIISKSPFIIPKTVKEVGKGNFVLMDETDPQVIGKVETYARRYGLQLALGLTAEDDEDGNKQARPAAPVQKTSVQKTAQPAIKQALTLEEIGKVEGVTVTEDDNVVTVGGKTFALANDLRASGFSWQGKTKTWIKDLDKNKV